MYLTMQKYQQTAEKSSVCYLHNIIRNLYLIDKPQYPYNWTFIITLYLYMYCEEKRVKLVLYFDNYVFLIPYEPYAL